MKILNSFAFLVLSILLLFSSANAQIPEVLIGDTDLVAKIGTNDHCRVFNFSYSHSNKNFHVNPYKDDIGFTLYWGLNCDVLFSPMTIGTQIDTFFLSGDGYFPDCNRSYHESAGPYIINVKGVSDSVTLFRTIDTNRIIFYWLVDSNKYIPENFLNVGLQKSFGFFNNVEDSSSFTMSLVSDTNAEIYPEVMIGSKNNSLPQSYNLAPQTRWVHGLINFNTASNGFFKDTTFIVYLKVVIQNHTIRDSFLFKYYIEYLPKPFAEVGKSMSPKEPQVQISTFINDLLNIYSLFLQPENASLELYDALGRQQSLPISEIEIPAGEYTQKLEVGNLSAGWYILRMILKDRVISKSFLVLH